MQAGSRCITTTYERVKLMTNLGGKARSAVIWNTGFNLFRDLLQFGSMLVLVRLLAPESYGQFAMVTSIMGFLSVLSHNNFIGHILQVKEEADLRYQEHFTAGAVIQGSLFLITNGVAFSLQCIHSYAPIAPLIHVMSVTFLLEWPCELRRKMLERELNWKRLRLLQILGLITGASLALFMGWAGAGTYTLLIPGMLVTLPFIYDLFIIEKWRPAWTWSWSSYREVWRFGLTRLGSGLVGSGRQLMETSVLTSVVGFAMLGIFGRSIGLAQLFCQKFASQLMYAIYPILTRIDGREGDPTRVGGLVLRIVAWTAMPIAVVFANLAAPVVRVVYGDNWTAVTPLLPWAMGWGVLGALSTATYMLLLAKQQSRLCFYADTGTLFYTVVSLTTALPHGLTVYIGVQSGFQLIAVGILSYWLWVHRALSLRGLFNAIFPPLLACLMAYGVLEFLIYVILDDVDFTMFSAIGWGSLFLIIYVVVLRLCFKIEIKELVNYFPMKQKIWRYLCLN